MLTGASVRSQRWAITVLDHVRQLLTYDHPRFTIHIHLCVGFRRIRVDLRARASRLNDGDADPNQSQTIYAKRKKLATNECGELF
jgi:hypothetical protein